MANLPEYTRQSPIQPASGHTDFASAMEGVGTTSGVIGELGLQVSQKAANEQARLQGLEAGKTPGRTLLPAFTQSDEEFVKAYKAQEYATVTNNASEYLNRLTFEAMKNPNAENLISYDQMYEQFIGNVTEGLAPETAEAVKESARAKYQTGRYQLESQIWKRDQQFLQENMEKAFKDSLKTISDAVENGNAEAVANVYATTTAMIDDKDINPDLSPAARENLKKVLIDTVADANSRKQMMGAIHSGKAEDLLKSAAEKPQTEANSRQAKVFYDTYRNYQAMTAAHDDVLITNAKTSMDNQTFDPTDMVLLKEKIKSKRRYAELERNVARFVATQQKDNANYAAIKKNANNVAFLSNVENKDLNTYLATASAQQAQMTGRPDDIFNKIDVASGVKAKFPMITDAASAILHGGAPQDVVKLMDAIIRTEDPENLNRNPFTFAGLSTKDRALVKNFQNRVLARNQPDQAYLDAKEAVFNVLPAELDARKLRFVENTRKNGSYDLSSLENLNKRAIQAIGLPKGLKVPPGLGLVFRRELEANNDAAVEWEDAVKMTGDKLRDVYGVSRINGQDEIMFLPPEMYVPGGLATSDIMHVQALSQVKTNIDAIRTRYNESLLNKKGAQLPFYYEIETNYVDKESLTAKAPSQTSAYYDLITGTVNEPDIRIRDITQEAQKVGEPNLGDIRVTKIFSDGTKQVGKLIIQADDRTAPAAGQMPNYYLGIEVNGVQSPILDPANPGKALRYIPDVIGAVRDSNEFRGMTNLEIFEELERRKIKKAPGIQYEDLTLNVPWGGV